MADPRMPLPVENNAVNTFRPPANANPVDMGRVGPANSGMTTGVSVPGGSTPNYLIGGQIASNGSGLPGVSISDNMGRANPISPMMPQHSGMPPNMPIPAVNTNQSAATMPTNPNAADMGRAGGSQLDHTNPFQNISNMGQYTPGTQQIQNGTTAPWNVNFEAIDYNPFATYGQDDQGRAGDNSGNQGLYS